MPFVTEGTMSPTKAGRNDAYGTPQALFDSLDEEVGGFDVDAAANHENHKCERYWTVEEDGLVQDWSGRKVFVNPPYGVAMPAWMRKCADSAERGATVYAVIPCRTDARWWADVMRATEIRLIRGRLHYNDGKQAAPFPSCIVVWTPHGPDNGSSPALSWVDGRTGAPA